METTLETSKNDIIGRGQKNLAQMSNLAMLNIGTILDSKYEITREIARGGMGIVYEAYNKYTHKRVAIKVILADNATPVQLKRFQKELDAYALLSHPNVITIYDAGLYNNNYPYMVMEYIDGVDICTYVKQQEKKNKQENSKNANGEQQGRDWKLCARLIYEVALGLDYIHSQKMIHRDIKPANILVRPNGSPVIIDLGLVKFHETQSYNLTKSREITGTIEYMPMEQAQGKTGNIDARTDVYSLGLVLYELLTGQKAYSGNNIMELVYKIMSYFPPLPREIDAQIPEVLEKITIRATEKQKNNRYASMKEFANALKQYLDDPTIKTISNDELKQHLDNTTAKQTPQYAQMTQKLLMHFNNNKVIASCIAVFLVIGLVIILSMSGTSNLEKQKDDSGTIDESKPADNRKPKNTTTTTDKPIQEDNPDNPDNPQEQFESGHQHYKKRNYKEAFEYFTKAGQEHAGAQYYLGLMYEKGYGVPQNYKEALECYEKSANKKFTPAQERLKDPQLQFNVGNQYYNGDGIEKDYQKALEWYEKSANQDYKEAQYYLGLMYEKGEGVQQSHKTALEWYEKAANQKFAPAQAKLKDPQLQFNVGNQYYNGDGVEKDYKKALEWYEKSANQDYKEAQYMLGEMSEKGECVQQSHKKALEWYKKATNQGFKPAQEKLKNFNDTKKQFDLGNQYYSGDGVQQNYQEAFYWYDKSANQGFKEAQYMLGEMSEKGEGIQQSDKEAFYWYEQSANQGFQSAQEKLKNFNDIKTQIQLGNKYYYGLGVKKNPQEAFYWYEQSAKKGDDYSQYMLGGMYYKGVGVSQDYEKAFKCYKKAANKGKPDAQYMVGEMYYKGVSVPQNYEKAFEWFEKAANKGQSDAKEKLNLPENQFKLGKIYFNKRDYEKAFECYKKAANKGQPDAQYELGMQDYKNGKYTKAFEWFGYAANQGHSDAQYRLGYMYEKKLGVDFRDNNKAWEWYKKATDQGQPDAIYKLGMRDYNNKKYKNAFSWFTKATEQEQADATYMLSVMYENGEGIERDDDKAVEYFEKAYAYYKKATDKGQADAIYNLGKLYYDKTSVEKNYRKAIELLVKAKNLGNKDAENMLKKELTSQCKYYRIYDYQLYYRYGTKEYNIKSLEKKAKRITDGDFQYFAGYEYFDHENNFVKAYEIWDLSAINKNGYAQCNLGVMNAEGRGVIQDYKKAVNWLQRSADQEVALAKYNLGLLYLLGLGVEQDIDKACKLFEQAGNTDADAKNMLSKLQ